MLESRASSTGPLCEIRGSRKRARQSLKNRPAQTHREEADSRAAPYHTHVAGLMGESQAASVGRYWPRNAFTNQPRNNCREGHYPYLAIISLDAIFRDCHAWASDERGSPNTKAAALSHHFAAVLHAHSHHVGKTVASEPQAAIPTILSPSSITSTTYPLLRSLSLTPRKMILYMSCGYCCWRGSKTQ